ncbi:DUF5988 family protein [Streptosporangium sp. NPDC048865]|uniref:DUF5988 family protein n=1 Tax=Streptosporangium sp. NPDC048865 TaxID=3155766 RepID=UPI00344207AA
MESREPNVILRGGPAWIPETERIRHHADPDSVIKLPWGNRYEHFKPTDETASAGLRVMEWTGFTCVAE